MSLIRLRLPHHYNSYFLNVIDQRLSDCIDVWTYAYSILSLQFFDIIILAEYIRQNYIFLHSDSNLKWFNIT